jgi:hypothetical protein
LKCAVAEHAACRKKSRRELLVASVSCSLFWFFLRSSPSLLGGMDREESREVLAHVTVIFSNQRRNKYLCLNNQILITYNKMRESAL